MSYSKKAQKLGEEITELNYKKIILQKEIARDEERLEFVIANPSKAFLIENLSVFERVLEEKEEELVEVSRNLKEKTERYNIYLSKMKA